MSWLSATDKSRLNDSERRIYDVICARVGRIAALDSSRTQATVDIDLTVVGLQPSDPEPIIVVFDIRLQRTDLVDLKIIFGRYPPGVSCFMLGGHKIPGQSVSQSAEGDTVSLIEGLDLLLDDWANGALRIMSTHTRPVYNTSTLATWRALRYGQRIDSGTTLRCLRLGRRSRATTYLIDGDLRQEVDQIRKEARE